MTVNSIWPVDCESPVLQRALAQQLAVYPNCDVLRLDLYLSDALAAEAKQGSAWQDLATLPFSCCLVEGKRHVLCCIIASLTQLPSAA